MKLKSVLVKGQIEKPLQYRLCHADPSMRRGVWEMAISSVSFKFTSRVSKSMTLSSNFVQDQKINSKGALHTSPSVLAVLSVFGNKNSSKTIGFKDRDFFEITVSDTLELNFAELTDDETVKEVKGAKAFVLLLFRQKA
jgi:hypothetical protein